MTLPCARPIPRENEPVTKVGVRGWTVWTVGTLVYAIAVLQRTSFGVAGMDAVERFGAPAGIVATFVVLQLLVYAIAQIPVGLALDRFGTRLMVTVGAALMGAGQLVMSQADNVGWGIAARVLVGLGDAMTFGSVVRLVPSWFPPRLVPVMTQLTGLLGQLGQVVAAVPLSMMLAGVGWSWAFGAAALAAGIACLASIFLIQDRPDGAVEAEAPRERLPLKGELAAVLRHPGTWLGLSSHWLSGFAPMVFAMMWGVPYLVQGEGRSRETASMLLSFFVVLGLFLGPIVGVLTQRHPLRRSNLVLAVGAFTAAAWLLVLLWPGPAPMWALLVLMVALAAGGPGSIIGFDFARTFTPAHRLGAATGVVIMGAFGAALVSILGIGMVLDATPRGPDGAYTLAGFRLAMAVQLPVLALGFVGVYASRARARRRWREDDGVVVPAWREVLRREFGGWFWR